MKKRSMLKTATGWTLTALTIAGLGGCATKTVPATHYYRIDIQTPRIETLTPGKPCFTSLEIAMAHPTRLTTGSDIFYLEKGHRQQPYSFSRWYETFGSMLENKLLLAFEKAHVAETVVGVVGGTRADYRLEIATLDAIQDFTGERPSKVRLSCLATLIKKKTRESVASKLFEIEVPAPSDDAEGGVAAFNEAADRIVTEIVRWTVSIPIQR
ncbi:ABC-type transport auxiliary lipoprotein family protein [Hydrogenimonas sp.]